MKPFPKLKIKIFILVTTFSSFFIRLACAENLDDTFPAEFSLGSLNGKNGFVIKGIEAYARPGTLVSGAGDVNGDGIADIIIGSPNAIKSAGQTYIIFGSYKGWPSAINVKSINSHNGLIVNGIHDSASGSSVSKAGDFNGDGIDDVVIGAPAANQAGQNYALFGKKRGWTSSFNLTDLDGNNGFAINCSVTGAKQCGYVQGGGDFNGDDIADILLGTDDATYVVFGGKKQWPASIDLHKVNGTDGFAIRGEDGVARVFGISGTSIGDINADNITDILIKVNITTVRDFVLFGSKEWPAVFNITDFNGINGFFIDGLKLSIPRRNAVGDINGDGIDDIWLGDQNSYPFASYIVFGSKEPWPTAINITNLDGNNGFTIYGVKNSVYNSQGGTGDVNGDGVDDILIGNAFANDLGRCYVVFGSKQKWPSSINVTNLDGDNGFVITGINKTDCMGFSVRIAKDINGDGVDDILTSATLCNEVGQIYVVLGRGKKTFETFDWLPIIISTVVLSIVGTFTAYHYYCATTNLSPPPSTPATNSPMINYHTID